MQTAIQMKPDEAKQLVIDAVVYALETMDDNMNYEKYVSRKFINTIDDQKFDFDQWVHHQKSIKKIVRSMKPVFKYLVSDGKTVAAIFEVHIVKNDGSKICVKDMAFFVIENGKIIYCDELTKIIIGSEEDKALASLQ